MEDFSAISSNKLFILMSKNYKKILSVIFLVVFLVGGGIFLADFLRNAELNILVAPIDAEILIDGKSFSNGTYRFYPGKVSVEIRKTGLISKKMEINLESNKTTRLHEYLLGNNSSMIHFEARLEDMEALKLIANDELSINFVKKYEYNSTLMSILPQKYNIEGNAKGFLDIENGSNLNNCKRIYCLGVVYNIENPEAKTAEMLKRLGYDIKDFYVIYQRVRN